MPVRASATAIARPTPTGTDYQCPRGGVEGTLHRNGRDHAHAVKIVANQPAVRVDPNRIDGTAGPGIGGDVLILLI